MRSLAVHSYCRPDKYEISTIPTPKITLPNHVLVKVHAASINPNDMEMAAGMAKMIVTQTFPMKIGWDLSGTVVVIGDSVKEFKVGDEVFGCMPFQYIGSWSEYALTSDEFIVLKPKGISHGEAASMPLVALTALQAFEKVQRGVEGNTVLITSGLGGVGSVACQMAKNAYQAGKVITTVSTEKVGKVEKLLGNGVVDQIVDYKKSDVLTDIPHGSVDLLIDSTHSALHSLPILTKKDGTILSVQGYQSGKNVKDIIPETSFLIQFLMNLPYWYFKFRMYLNGFRFDSVLNKPTKERMQVVANSIEEGKIRPVVGKTVKLEDIEAVREACKQIESGKGGIGKVVIEIS